MKDSEDGRAFEFSELAINLALRARDGNRYIGTNFETEMSEFRFKP